MEQQKQDVPPQEKKKTPINTGATLGTSNDAIKETRKALHTSIRIKSLDNYLYLLNNNININKLINNLLNDYVNNLNKKEFTEEQKHLNELQNLQDELMNLQIKITIKKNILKEIQAHKDKERAERAALEEQAKQKRLKDLMLKESYLRQKGF